jgi:hypothetical protein
MTHFLLPLFCWSIFGTVWSLSQGKVGPSASRANQQQQQQQQLDNRSQFKAPRAVPVDSIDLYGDDGEDDEFDYDEEEVDVDDADTV